MYNTLFQELGNYLNIDMFPHEHPAERPANTIYGEYEIFETKYAERHQWEREQQEIENDMIEIKNSCKVRDYITVFYCYQGNDFSQMDVIKNNLDLTWMWINDEGKKLPETSGMVITRVPADSKRDYEVDSNNNVARVGIDLCINRIFTKTETIEKIVKVDYDGGPEV